MLSKLLMRFGRIAGAPPEELSLTPVTVFVGPNNSGKSLVLNEIHQLAASGSANRHTRIVRGGEFVELTENLVQEAFNELVVQPRPFEPVERDHVLVGHGAQRFQIPEKELLATLRSPNTAAENFARWYVSRNTLMLDGTARMNLVREQSAGDFRDSPTSSFQVLFRDDAKRSALRRSIFQAFHCYLVVDPTKSGHLRLTLSDVEPSSRLERSLDDEALAFHAKTTSIDGASDGVRAFTGIMTEIIADDPKVILMDEPEAFLHPGLAFKLGKDIAGSMRGSERRLFVSTHSPQFVMGCVQSGAPINIVRLTYRSGVATARVLPSSDLINLMRNPLLRSTGLLSALFYESVVITESDTDRAFYQEVNERLLAIGDDRGIPNCLFLNAQNKQTVQQLMRPLRNLGISTAAIVDIDVVKDGGQTWINLLTSANIPQPTHQSLSSLRVSVKQLFEETGKSMKTDGGIGLLTGPKREAVDSLLDQLSEYGVFVVPGGEVESWLEHLSVAGHGPPWLIEIFKKMGDDPERAEYVVPEERDVWEFMSAIGRWLTRGDRKGIPS